MKRCAVLLGCLGIACTPVGQSTPIDASSTETSVSTSTTPSSPTAAEVDFTLEPNEGNRLSAFGRVTSPSETTLHIAYGEAGGDLNRQTPEVTIEAGVETEIVVLGLYPGEWEAAVVVGGIEGTREAVTTSVPQGYRATTVTSNLPDDAWTEDEAICASLEAPAYACTDRWGRPTLYIALPGNMMFVRALSDGTFLGHPDGPDYLLHFDVAGRQLKRIQLEDLTDLTYEHGWIDEHESLEITEGPWAGMWGVLTATWDETNNGGAIGAGLIVFDPETLQVAWDWSSHGVAGDRESVDEAMLPYRRTGLAPWYGEDWLHANAVIHGIDASGTDFFWMSLRHQDWVIRIDAPSGDIRWRFGYQGDFELVDDLDAASPVVQPNADFMYHQHAPELKRLADGRVEMLLLDNGNVRANDQGDLTEPGYSRAVRFLLDESTGKAKVDWAYGDPSGQDQWFAAAAGDADRMPNEDGVIFVKAVGDAFIRHVDTAGEVLWNQSVDGQGELYRVEFYESLYNTSWWTQTGW